MRIVKGLLLTCAIMFAMTVLLTGILLWYQDSHYGEDESYVETESNDDVGDEEAVPEIQIIEIVINHEVNRTILGGELYDRREPRYELEFSPVTGEAQKHGFIRRVETDFARYYISDSIVGGIHEHVHRYERLFAELRAFGLPVRTQTLYLIEKKAVTEEIKEWISSRGERYIYPLTEVSTLGSMLFYFYEEAFPLWFSNGLAYHLFEGLEEMFSLTVSEMTAAKEDILQRELPPFGDAWFTYFMANAYEYLHRTTERMAYTLAGYLLENDKMRQLFPRRLGDEPPTLVSLFQESFCEFLIEAIKESLYTALCNVFLTRGTKQAFYTFDTIQWRYEVIHHYLDGYDQGILFARNFLALGNDEPLLVYFRQDGQQQNEFPFAGEASWDGSFSIFRTTDNPANVASLIVHEATHAFLIIETDGDWRVPEVLVEGFATLVEYSFVAHYYWVFDFFRNDWEWYRAYHQGWLNPEDTLFWERYCILSGCTFAQGAMDVMALLDTHAFFETIDPNHGIGKMYLPRQSGIFLTNNEEEEGAFNTYRQSGSFVQFLVRQHGIDTVIDLYRDHEMVEEIVGANWNELARNWRESLGINY